MSGPMPSYSASRPVRRPAATPAGGMPEPALARCLVQWLLVGALCVLLLPAARAQSVAGWLPFWLVLAPAASLAVLFRQRLLAAVLALAPGPGPRSRSQARRIGAGRARRARAGTAAGLRRGARRALAAAAGVLR